MQFKTQIAAHKPLALQEAAVSMHGTCKQSPQETNAGYYRATLW